MPRTHDLLRRYVALFNVGVRAGDYDPMLEGFTEDAEVFFKGLPIGPFRGREVIATAFVESSPDDEVRLGDIQDEGPEVVADYAWAADPGRRAGQLHAVYDGDLIARLVVTVD